MNIIKVYKPLTYILALPAAYIALTIFSLLMQGIFNQLILLLVFILACFVVYTIMSFIFLKNVLINQKQVKKIIKDLMRINGTIAFIFSVIMLLFFAIILTNTSLLSKSVEIFFEENRTQIPPQYTKEMMITNFKKRIKEVYGK